MAFLVFPTFIVPPPIKGVNVYHLKYRRRLEDWADYSLGNDIGLNDVYIDLLPTYDAEYLAHYMQLLDDGRQRMLFIFQVTTAQVDWFVATYPETKRNYIAMYHHGFINKAAHLKFIEQMFAATIWTNVTPELLLASRSQKLNRILHVSSD